MSIKRFALKILISLRIYPHIFFTSNPFKIYEFNELQRGVLNTADELILDVGCGSGLQTFLLGNKCKQIIGIDSSEQAIKIAERRLSYMRNNIHSEFYCVRIEDAEFEDEYFDKVFSICVIEHINDCVETLRKVYRILKQDGQFIFSVDSLETIEDSKLIEKHKKEHFVENYFKKEELEKILGHIGFKRIEIYPILKSNLARKLFIKGINSNFKYGYLRSILTYFILKYAEHPDLPQKKGIFLIAKCSK